MPVSKSHIIAQLQREILSLQGYKECNRHDVETGLGPLLQAFPHHVFPTGAVHEFCSYSPEDSAATGGFVSGILGALMKRGGICIWISSYCSVFPPALQSFGVQPEAVIFINLRKEKEILWAMEEALKCESLMAVVGEVQELSFTNSRRFQLATEQSRVTGFVLRHNPGKTDANACIARWKISPLASYESGVPGVGFPCWNAELLKVRNGKPGCWQIQFAAGRFNHIEAEMTELNAKAV